jgi:general stress protein 26
MADEIFDADHGAALRELWSLIKDVRIAMLTTVGTDGRLHSRPMATQQVEPEDVLWFFSAKDSPKVEELTENQHVELTYADPGRNLYVAASGRAQVVDDRVKMRELWNTAVQAWFPDGPDDPHLCLLRVDLDEAEYWLDRKPKALRLTQLLTAAVSGRPPQSGLEDRKLQL